MLEQSLKNQVEQLFANLSNEYTFSISVNDTHSGKDELIELLSEVASCSDRVNCEVSSGDDLSFTILKNGQASNVIFKAIPNGHEFTTLLLAVLNQDGIGKNLPDTAVVAQIKALKGTVELRSYISLSCTNCPDVVQVLNIMAFINPNITHYIIDGGINKEEVDSKNIQAVPSVYANGEPLHIGRSSLVELLSKLEVVMGSEPIESVNIEKKNYDVVVVGGGPAGTSAAIYSARKGFSVAIVAQKIGGQVNETVDIENLISVPKTTGSELASNLKLHLQDYPIDILENRLVDKIDIVEGVKHITTSLGETLVTPAVIVATGASWRQLNVPGESQYIGSGVAFCTHCDGPFYKDKKVIVVGGGNSGLEAAVDLSSIAKEVIVLEFAESLNGDKVLSDQLEKLPNVSIITNAQTTEVRGDGSKVDGLVYRDRESDQEHTIDTDGIFVQIGLTANSSTFKDIVKTNRIGEIEIDATCRTSVPGIYAAGDVSIVPYKQIIIAMGEGSKAALSAFEDKIKGEQISTL